MRTSREQSRFEGATLVVGGDAVFESYDARFLISTLLVYVARSDGHISELESNRMIDLLSTQLHMPGPEALARLRDAVMDLANDSDIARRMQRISRGLTHTEKLDVLRMMLQVMAADGVLERSERDAVAMGGQILGLSPDTIHAELRSIAGPD